MIARTFEDIASAATSERNPHSNMATRLTRGGCCDCKREALHRIPHLSRAELSTRTHGRCSRECRSKGKSCQRAHPRFGVQRALFPLLRPRFFSLSKFKAGDLGALSLRPPRPADFDTERIIVTVIACAGQRGEHHLAIRLWLSGTRRRKARAAKASACSSVSSSSLLPVECTELDRREGLMASTRAASLGRPHGHAGV